MKILTKLLAISAVVLLLSGCGINKGVVTDSMDNADYLSASEAERSAYLNKIQAEEQALAKKRSTEYMLGRPVPFGDGDTRYTKQWDKDNSIVHVYPGHAPGGTGIEAQSVLSMRTDENGNVLYDQTGKPIVILANVATQEELGRVLIKGGFQVAAGAVNGMGASLINRLVNAGDCSNGGCGTQVVNQNLVSSKSDSTADAAVKAGVSAVLGTCPSNNCVPVSME